MKKKIPFKYPFKMKKWHVFLGIVCTVGFIVSIVVGLHTINEKKEVSAHPSNTIKLDEGGANEFEVPTDGSTNLEYAQGTNYEDYLQEDSFSYSLSKIRGDDLNLQTRLWSSGIRNSIANSYVTGNGNVISLQTFTSYPYTAHTWKNAAKVILQRPEGDEESEWVHHTPADRSSPNEAYSVSNATLIKVEENEFLVIYTVGRGANTRPIVFSRYRDNGGHLFQVGNENELPNVDNLMEGQGTRAASMIKPAPDNDPNRVLLLNGVVIENTANNKQSYNMIEFDGTDGSITQGQSYKFEAHSDVQLVNGTDDQASIIPNNFSFISSNECIGIEEIKINGITRKFLCKWTMDSSTMRATREQISDFNGYSPSPERAITTNEDYYFRYAFVDGLSRTRVRIGKYSVTNDTLDMNITEFPLGTTLKFARHFDDSNNHIGYFFGGQITDVNDPVFNGIGQNGGAYCGYMNTDFEWQSATLINVDFHSPPGSISFSTLNGNEDSDFFVLSGTIVGEETNFVDEVTYGNYPGDPNSIIGGREKEILDQTPFSGSRGNGFVAQFSAAKDWAPLLKAPSSFNIDITDNDIKSNNQDVISNWLLTGSKNGSFNDASSIKVYDTFDMDRGLDTYSNDWLLNRINANINTLVYDPGTENIQSKAPIEWGRLGFDRSTVGPTVITYFITDSLNQTSTASTKVNKVTPQTVEYENYLLDAQNFHIPLNDIETAIPDDATKVERFKELAKTMAWNTDDGVVDEDGTDSSKLSDKVTVDALQLKALREAEVAKPYPVDVTYVPEDGVSITNRVWVFVTTKNTLPNNESIYPEVTPDETNGIVYYADDYSIPFRNRRIHDPDNVLDMGNVRVYDYYDFSHEDSDELPALADARNNINRDQLQVINLANIHMAFEPGIIRFVPLNPGTAIIRYEWDGDVNGYHQSGEDHPTFGGLDVTLTGDVLLHVRQVILDDSDKLTIPTEGYLNLKSYEADEHGGHNGPEDIGNLRKVKVPSEENSDHPTFETFVVGLNHMTTDQDRLTIEPIVPEFYEYFGYYWTDPEIESDLSEHHNRDESDIVSDQGLWFYARDGLVEHGEFYITIYLKPKLPEKGPQPYSWDYKVNDFGVIQTE